MTVRDTIMANVTTAVSSTGIGVSSELPWVTGDVPLYEKNLKKIYFDVEQTETTQLHTTLDRSDVFQTETTMNAYLTVNAKNLPAGINTVVSAMQNARLSVTGYYRKECSVSTEMEEDRITYVFEYKLANVN